MYPILDSLVEKKKALRNCTNFTDWRISATNTVINLNIKNKEAILGKFEWS